MFTIYGWFLMAIFPVLDNCNYDDTNTAVVIVMLTSLLDTSWTNIHLISGWSLTLRKEMVEVMVDNYFIININIFTYLGIWNSFKGYLFMYCGDSQ